jgi:hypothetical protein
LISSAELSAPKSKPFLGIHLHAIIATKTQRPANISDRIHSNGEHCPRQPNASSCLLRSKQITGATLQARVINAKKLATHQTPLLTPYLILLP